MAARTTEQTCAWCGGFIDTTWTPPDDALVISPGDPHPMDGDVHLDHVVDPGQGHKGSKWWCSETCRKIVAGTHWPTPVGPATHDEMVGWIEEQARLDALRARPGRVAPERLEDLWEEFKEFVTARRLG